MASKKTVVFTKDVKETDAVESVHSIRRKTRKEQRRKLPRASDVILGNFVARTIGCRTSEFDRLASHPSMKVSETDAFESKAGGSPTSFGVLSDVERKMLARWLVHALSSKTLVDLKNRCAVLAKNIRVLHYRTDRATDHLHLGALGVLAASKKTEAARSAQIRKMQAWFKVADGKGEVPSDAHNYRCVKQNQRDFELYSNWDSKKYSGHGALMSCVETLAFSLRAFQDIWPIGRFFSSGIIGGPALAEHLPAPTPVVVHFVPAVLDFQSAYADAQSKYSLSLASAQAKFEYFLTLTEPISYPPRPLLPSE